MAFRQPASRVAGSSIRLPGCRSVCMSGALLCRPVSLCHRQLPLHGIEMPPCAQTRSTFLLHVRVCARPRTVSYGMLDRVYDRTSRPGSLAIGRQSMETRKATADGTR